MASKKILVVEDEHIIAMELMDRLESLGYHVPTIVTSGEKAIAKSKELAPDLILMDIRLKGEIDGIAAAEKIQIELDIPVVYITAYADTDTLERAKRVSNPFYYLTKPIIEDELQEKVAHALSK